MFIVLSKILAFQHKKFCCVHPHFFTELELKVISPMIMRFGTDIRFDAFYTMVKKFMTSLLLRNYDVITCI